MSGTFPFLTVLGLTPLVGVLVILALPRGRDLLVKQVALVTSLVVLALTVVIGLRFEPGGARFQLAEAHDWIPAFGVQYAVGVDGIALVLVALIAVLVPVVLLASWHDADPVAEVVHDVAASRSSAYVKGRPGDPELQAGQGRESVSSVKVAAGGTGAAILDRPGSPPDPRRGSVKTLFSLMLILETMMIGVFVSTDIFLFYVFFEAMLIPMYFLIGQFGGPRRSYAAMKFLLYSLFGGLIMLAAVIGLYVASAGQLTSGTFNFLALTQLDLSHSTQIWLFLGFFIAFAIKAPLFPFHTWLPDAGAEAPIGVAVLLVGVLDKVGTFGFIRYCLPLFPDASKTMAPYVITLSVIGILYGSLLAMGQRDLKRLVAYTSVAHFGFIGLGVFAFTTQAQTGAVLYMVNHGLSTGALFLVVGFLIVRGRTRDGDAYGGIAKVAPLLAGTFLIAGLSSLALPGLSTFVSEFLVLVGSFQRYEVATVLATIGIVLSSIYIFLMYQRTMQGPIHERHLRMPDLGGREVLAVAPLLALMIFLGFYPKPLTDVINPAVACTQVDLGFADPTPEDSTVVTPAVPACAQQTDLTGGAR